MSLRKTISNKLVEIAKYIDPDHTTEHTNERTISEESVVVANAVNKDSDTAKLHPPYLFLPIAPIPVGVSINMSETVEKQVHDDHDKCVNPDDSCNQNGPPTKKPRVRNDGCDRLAIQYCFDADKNVEFDEPSHKYTVYGKPVKRSTTSIVHDQFEPFNGDLIVEKHYASWKERQDKRYMPHIMKASDDQGQVDDNLAKRLIVQHWADEGKKASDFGTKMHLYAEQVLNWDAEDGSPHPTAHPDVQVEGLQFDAFMKSDFVTQRQLEPIRTELTVFYMRGGTVVTAGQIDALFRSKLNGAYYILDWKRIKPDKRIDANAHAFSNGVGLASSIPDTPHYHYSLQTSIYSLMLRESHGIDAKDNMYLVRMHADCPQGYELVKCTDLRTLAEQVLMKEYASLTAHLATSDQPTNPTI